MDQKPHHRLIVWRKSIDLIKAIYQLTGCLPSDERFNLTDQMRRAAISIASNIAEGAGRRSTGEKLYFFHVARVSLTELDTQLEICEALAYISSSTRQPIQGLVDQTSRLLYGLITSRQTSGLKAPLDRSIA